MGEEKPGVWLRWAKVATLQQRRGLAGFLCAGGGLGVAHADGVGGNFRGQLGGSFLVGVIMGNVVPFKPKAQNHNKQVQQQAQRENKELAQQHRLADWLREIADYIEQDLVEVEPLAAILVLSGRHADEVLNIGYQEDGVDFEAACRAPLRRFCVRSTDMQIFRRD